MAYNAFLCHSHRDAPFALGLAAYLKRHLDEVFCFEEQQRPDASFVAALNRALARSNVLVTVIGDTVSEWQIREVNDAYRERGGERSFFTVRLCDSAGKPHAIPDDIQHLRSYVVIDPAGTDQASIQDAASRIVTGLGISWRSDDDLPLDPHLFSYEKDVISFYIRKARLAHGPPASDEEAAAGEEIRRKILHGCPPEWPAVVKWPGTIPNQLGADEIGICRDESASVLTTALLDRDTRLLSGGAEEAVLPRLSFPEAGPRQTLYFPRGGQLTVAILVSGGIAPGINAVIDGIVQRHWLYAERHGYAKGGLTVTGLLNGFRAFADPSKNHVLLAASPRNVVGPGTRLETSNHVNEGGSILGTSRVDDLLDLDQRETELTNIVSDLKNVDILYVIGGDGSMKAAHAIWSRAQTANRKRGPLSVVAIPKTMDNDILWVWQSFGFLSAVEKAREVIEQLNTEVISNPRLCIAQLFGSDSGFVVSHAVLASGTGHCDLALIPEVEFRMDRIAEYLTRKIAERHKPLPYALVVLAETAIPKDAMRYVGEVDSAPEIDIGLSKDEKKAIREFEALRDRKRRIQGQTNDHLRTAGLKIVSQGLKELLPVQSARDGLTDWSKLRVFTNEPRHLLRAIPPSCTDIIIGHRLGTLAVDNAMAGYTDFMISQWLTEYVLVPLRLVVLGRKRIPQAGIFWKSVLAKTGQPAVLT